MKRYLRLIIRLRWPIIVAVALLTAVSAWMLSHAVMSSTIGGMFLGEHPDYEDYLERSERFGNSDVLAVAFRTSDPLSAQNQARLAGAVQNVKNIAGVTDVHSILDVQDIDPTEDGIEVRTYAEKALKDPSQAGPILDELQNDPFAGGLLISGDGRHVAVVIELDVKSDIPAENIRRLINELVESFTSQGYANGDLHVVGLPASIAAIVDATSFNIKRILPIVCLVLIIAVWIMFRRLWPVFITMAVALIAVIWTMGFSVLLDRNLNILASMVPAVVLIISFSDVIHLCSAYLLELGGGLKKDEAIMASGSDVGAACLMTSLTTFVGFIALSMVPAPAFRHLGKVLGFGVAVALLLAMTLVPILFSLMPRPKPWRTGAAGSVQDALDRALAFLSKLTLKRPKTIAAFSAVVLLLAAVGIAKLNIETDFVKRLSEKNRVSMDNRYFHEHFEGSNMIDLYFETGEQDGLFDPEVFGKIASAQQQMLRRPAVSGAISLADLMRTMHGAMTGGPDNAGALPQSRQALAQYLLLFEMSGGRDLDRLVDFNRQTMRMTLRVPGQGVVHTYNTGLEAQNLAADVVGPGVKVQATGLIFLVGQWLDEIVAGQKRGLAFALVCIALMMMLGLRSIKIGLWSMLPNVLPLLCFGGWLGLAWDQVDSDALALAMIAIGIGVDDTIHFLMRLKIESRRSPDIATAVERTFHFSGRGIVITTIILVAGFSPFALSEYLSLHMLGTLLPMILIVALLADLLLVPALVALGVMQHKRSFPRP